MQMCWQVLEIVTSPICYSDTFLKHLAERFWN